MKKYNIVLFVLSALAGLAFWFTWSYDTTKLTNVWLPHLIGLFTIIGIFVFIALRKKLFVWIFALITAACYFIEDILFTFEHREFIDGAEVLIIANIAALILSVAIFGYLIVREILQRKRPVHAE